MLKKMETRGEIIRRVLVIIDEMAARRHPASLQTITHNVNNRMGQQYSTRTIRRDLIALTEVGLMDCYTEQSAYKWKLNLRLSENAQRAAIATTQS